MARIKNKHGLTPQQEAFCQYVVDAYGTDRKGILVTAYRMAYNCNNETRKEVHYVNASKLYKDAKIRLRIEQLQEQQAEHLSISRERIISDDVERLNIDPLDLWIFDEKKKQWRMRYLHEIPKKIRKLLKFSKQGNRIIPDIDKDAAIKRLIDVLGFASAKDLNVTTRTNLAGELLIGFDEDEE